MKFMYVFNLKKETLETSFKYLYYTLSSLHLLVKILVLHSNGHLWYI